MPAPLKIDKEAVRVLVVAIGPRAAARELGIPENTVLDWCAKGKWLEGTRVIPASRQPPTSMLPTISPIKSPAEALRDTMDSLSERSKLGFLKASARVAEHLGAEEDPDALLARAKSASGWAKTAALAGGWAGNGAGTVVQVSVGLRLEMD